ncbi:hypothetical protein QJS10_CPB11g01746 [Acorus calamus]|uniref:Uncharacterized protein n=1 Tax=Acorus calamus TaxID=4465 RepID=A0AAV9DTS7_ACOCL|nr:hypothetical protein QJS10_CPB11g01746 [Acorus calamus]
MGKPAEDVRLHIGFAPGSPPGEITAFYTCDNPSVLVCGGSSVVRIEDLYAEEDRRQRPLTGVGELFQRSGVAGAPLLQMIHGGPDAEGRHIITSEDRTVEEPLRDHPHHGKVPKTRDQALFVVCQSLGGFFKKFMRAF